MQADSLSARNFELVASISVILFSIVQNRSDWLFNSRNIAAFDGVCQKINYRENWRPLRRKKKAVQ